MPAPSNGRVIAAPATEGSVVVSGESIATSAANGHRLRLELPERHARSMHDGDAVHLASRNCDGPGAETRRVRR